MLIADYLLAGAWGQRRDTRDKKDKSKRASQPFGKNPPLMIMWKLSAGQLQDPGSEGAMRNPLFGEAAAPRSHESGLGSRGKS